MMEEVPSRQSGATGASSDESGCPTLSFDDSDLQMQSELFDDETEEEFEDLDVTLDESNVEFEFDFGTDSVAKELSVLAAFSDIAEHGIVEVFGDDRFGRKIVSINACRIPPIGDSFRPPRFLQYLLQLLDLYVENDYTLIYFHHGLDKKSRMSLKWLVQAYRSFDRKYKKNLKALYVVHPTSFIKVVYRIFSPILSYKFGQKMIYIRSLSELSQHVDIRQISIPGSVLEYDSKLVISFSARNASPDIMRPIETSQFGVTLAFLKANNDGQVVPRALFQCVDHVRQSCMSVEHIFRRSVPVSMVTEVSALYNQGRHVDLPGYDDPHLAPVLIKSFLRRLPEPIMTYEIFKDIIQLPALDEPQQLALLRRVVHASIPEDNYIVLELIIALLRDVALRKAETQMNAQALGIVFGPNLLWARNGPTDLPALNAVNHMTQLLIEHYSDLFSRELPTAAPNDE